MLSNRFISMPNLNNVSSPSLWQRIWQGFWPLWVPSSSSAYLRHGLNGWQYWPVFFCLSAVFGVWLLHRLTTYKAIATALFLFMCLRPVLRSLFILRLLYWALFIWYGKLKRPILSPKPLRLSVFVVCD